jgi:energy-converting hydrogenase Eha subunit C
MRYVNRPAAAAVVAMIVAGAVIISLSDPLDTASVIGFVLLAGGAILAMALAFYAVGRSEDADRERHPRG